MGIRSWPVPHLQGQFLKQGRVWARAPEGPPAWGRLWNTEFHGRLCPDWGLSLGWPLRGSTYLYVSLIFPPRWCVNVLIHIIPLSLMVAFVRYLQKHNVILRWVYLLLRRFLALFLIVQDAFELGWSNAASNKWWFSYKRKRAYISSLLKIATHSFLTCLSLHSCSLGMTLNHSLSGCINFITKFQCEGSIWKYIQVEGGGRIRRKAGFTVFMSDVKLAKLTAWTFRLLFAVFAFVIFSWDKEQKIVSSLKRIFWDCQKENHARQK